MALEAARRERERTCGDDLERCFCALAYLPSYLNLCIASLWLSLYPDLAFALPGSCAPKHCGLLALQAG